MAGKWIRIYDPLGIALPESVREVLRDMLIHSDSYSWLFSLQTPRRMKRRVLFQLPPSELLLLKCVLR